MNILLAIILGIMMAIVLNKIFKIFSIWFEKKTNINRDATQFILLVIALIILIYLGKADYNNRYPKTSWQDKIREVNLVYTIEAKQPTSEATERLGVVYGYSSTVEECDNDPFTTASGQQVRDGIVANNFYPFGTKVEIAGKVYEVQDRMNKKYGRDVWDIWFSDRQDAYDWGVRNLEVKIYN